MPGAPISLTSTLKLAKQTAKGTAATTGFICGRYTQSNMQPILDYIEAQDEHFCGVNPRATTRKSLSRPSGYVGAFGGMGFLYPDLLGNILLGLGFASSAPTGSGAAKTHVFTLGNRSDAKWLTALYSTGDGGDKFERRLTDARVEMYRLDGSVKGLEQVFAGFGITEDEAAGTETSTNETDAMLLPSRGEATVNVLGGSFTSAFRTTRLQIANTLDRAEQKLFAFKRDDLPQKGLDVTGILGRIDLEKDIYKKMYWAAPPAPRPCPRLPTATSPSSSRPPKKSKPARPTASSSPFLVSSCAWATSSPAART